MNILIVSQQKYSHTNRGIDNISEVLSENHNVTHLCFFSRIKYEKYKIGKIYQIFFEDKIKLYRDKFKYFVPGGILLFYFAQMIKKNKEYDFSKYDYAIIESGYPIYLGLFLSIPVIYRQSDPTEIAFNSNRLFYKFLERVLIKKSLKCSSAFPIEKFPKSYRHKYSFWKTGFNKSSSIEDYRLIAKTNTITYMGKYPIDEVFLKKVAKTFPDITIYVIGDYKNLNVSNIVCTGYLNNDEYEKIIASSKLFIIPFKRNYLKHLRIQGITSKYYFPMELGIPILVRKHGYVKDDKLKKIYTYRNKSEGLNLIRQIFWEEKNDGAYFKIDKSTVDFIAKQTISNKTKEIKEFFRI